jgi:hypothetical protein
MISDLFWKAFYDQLLVLCGAAVALCPNNLLWVASFNLWFIGAHLCEWEM